MKVQPLVGWGALPSGGDQQKSRVLSPGRPATEFPCSFIPGTLVPQGTFGNAWRPFLSQFTEEWGPAGI